MRILKQSTATNIMEIMVDGTDHVTGKTGLTLTITASKDGAAFASISPTVTDRGNGWYKIELTTSHTDTLGELALHITGTGADPSDVPMRVVGGSLDADVSTRLATSGYTAPANSDIAAIKAKTDNLPSDPADASDIASAFSAVNGNLTTIAGYIDTEVAAIKAKTDNLPASPAATSDVPSAATVASAVRTELTTELAHIDADISSRATASALATVAGYVDTEVAAIKAKTDNLPASPAATSDVPSAATVASAVRTELATELARVDVAVSTRMAAASYTAPLDAAGVRTAVGLASANLDTQIGALPTAAENADKHLVRNLAGGSDGGRTVQDALRSLRNKTSISAGTLTVCQEDDTTPAWTAAVTTTPGDPLSAIDPA